MCVRHQSTTAGKQNWVWSSDSASFEAAFLQVEVSISKFEYTSIEEVDPVDGWAIIGAIGGVWRECYTCCSGDGDWTILASSSRYIEFRYFIIRHIETFDTMPNTHIYILLISTLKYDTHIIYTSIYIRSIYIWCLGGVTTAWRSLARVLYSCGYRTMIEFYTHTHIYIYELRRSSIIRHIGTFRYCIQHNS